MSTAGTPRDFRMGDWGEPHRKEGEEQILHLAGVREAQLETDESRKAGDFREADWGTPENATVVTPGAIDVMPNEKDGSKSDWESYAQQKGFDTHGLNKQQIIDMVKQGQMQTGEQPVENDTGENK